ncbi:MAG: zf-HC2 domain-containing protein [bacterium]|nr:zf-HC2 domain-containing protein [bacterium]
MMEGHYDTPTLIDYLRGELDAETDAAVFTHLESCDSCRAEYRAELELGEALRRAAQDQTRELPSEVVARIRMATRQEPKPAGIALWLGARRAAWAIPAAAVLALAIWLTGNALRPSAPETASIDASYYLQAHAVRALSIPGERSGPIAFLDGAAAKRPHIDPAFVNASDAYLGEMAPLLSRAGSGS